MRRRAEAGGDGGCWLDVQVMLSTMMALLPLLMRFLRLMGLSSIIFAVLGVTLFGGGIYDGAEHLAGTVYDDALGLYSYLPVCPLTMCSRDVIYFFDWLLMCVHDTVTSHRQLNTSGQ